MRVTSSMKRPLPTDAMLNRQIVKIMKRKEDFFSRINSLESSSEAFLVSFILLYKQNDYVNSYK